MKVDQTLHDENNAFGNSMNKLFKLLLIQQIANKRVHNDAAVVNIMTQEDITYNRKYIFLQFFTLFNGPLVDRILH